MLHFQISMSSIVCLTIEFKYQNFQKKVLIVTILRMSLDSGNRLLRNKILNYSS